MNRILWWGMDRNLNVVFFEGGGGGNGRDKTCHFFLRKRKVFCSPSLCPDTNPLLLIHCFPFSLTKKKEEVFLFCPSPFFCGAQKSPVQEEDEGGGAGVWGQGKRRADTSNYTPPPPLRLLLRFPPAHCNTFFDIFRSNKNLRFGSFWL